MDDLILRLRRAADTHLAQTVELCGPADKLLLDAAAEIERLLTELHEAGDGDTWREACRRCENELEKLYAENSQLRAERDEARFAARSIVREVVATEGGEYCHCTYWVSVWPWLGDSE